MPPPAKANIRPDKPASQQDDSLKSEQSLREETAQVTTLTLAFFLDQNGYSEASQFLLQHARESMRPLEFARAMRKAGALNAIAQNVESEEKPHAE
jgi:hypothetical protein